VSHASATLTDFTSESDVLREYPGAIVTGQCAVLSGAARCGHRLQDVDDDLAAVRLEPQGTGRWLPIGWSGVRSQHGDRVEPTSPRPARRLFTSPLTPITLN